MGAVRTLESEEASLAADVRTRRWPMSPGRLAAASIFFLVALIALPWFLSSYWLLIMTSVVIYSIVTLGLGLLIGRVGMVSLCQFVLLAIGAWVALRFAYASSPVSDVAGTTASQVAGSRIPFPVLILLAGLITGAVGTLIGLPALRLSGLHLALVTLMAAGAITILLQASQFPNGGGGFFGNSATGGATSTLSRPSIATTDTGYYRYCVVVAGVMFVIALWHVRSKAGRAWAAIRQGEATALSAGVNTTFYKLWAFALASFMAGIAGGLLAAATGGVNINQFPVQNSITLLAVVLMGGVYNLFGAVIAALFSQFLPALLDNWGLSTELLTILFGIGVLQVLLTAPGGVVEQFPKDMAKLGRRIGGLVTGKGKSGKSGRAGTSATSGKPGQGATVEREEATA
jgi:branched-chain amino acid transport system permease protein